MWRVNTTISIINPKTVTKMELIVDKENISIIADKLHDAEDLKIALMLRDRLRGFINSDMHYGIGVIEKYNGICTNSDMRMAFLAGMDYVVNLVSAFQGIEISTEELIPMIPMPSSNEQ